MTVASSTSRIQYNCNGATPAFAFSFGVGATSEIQVILTSSLGVETILTETTHYTISATNDDYSSGGTVTTVATYATGNTITILRNVPLTQASDFTEGMPTLYETFETGLDKLTRITQQQQEQISRTPLLKSSSAYLNLVFPEPEGSKLIGWNATSSALENKILSVTALNSTYIKYLSNYASFAAAVASIGGSETTLMIDITADVAVNTTTPATLQMICVKIGSFAVSTGVTFTINGSFDAGFYQVFSLTGTGTVRFGPGSVREIVPQWFGASPSATAAVNSAAFQAALDSMGTYPSVPLYIPGASTGSVGNYDINVALTKTSADWIRITGDGSGSSLEWTGADYATILSLTGAASGNAAVDSVRFDCNGKATTGLALAGFGHGVSVTKCEFNDGLANVADNQGMLNIPLDGETHNGLLQRNIFNGGTAIGLALGLTGASSAGTGFDVSVNEFQQINNIAIKGKGLRESKIVTNILDNVYATQLNGGFCWLDIVADIDISNNHIEGSNEYAIKLNTTGRYTFKPMTAMIHNNLITGGNLSIYLGYTDDVELSGNSILGNTAGVDWLTVTANAFGTVVGKNTFSNAMAGGMGWAEQYIGGAGLWSLRYAQTPVASTTAVLSLTGQSSSAAWVELTPISTLNAPDIPSNFRALVVQASIMSATVGARLYMVNEGNAPLWANRSTDIRVQYIEAQTANRYNTATFIIPIKNQSYEDAIYYSIDPTGVNDTDVELRLVGYLMPT